MNVDAYRKKLARKVAAATKEVEKARRSARDADKSDEERIHAMAEAGPARAPDRAYARTVAADHSKPTELRAAAIRQLTPSPADKDNLIAFLIERLADDGEAVEVRSAAAATLKLASFHVRGLREHRADYLAALRAASKVDDPALRERVLGVLAREKDASTLRALEAGLRDPSRAVVDPEKALQLLSYDTKRDLRDLLHAIVKKPPSPAARLQALRNLAGDTSSKALFTKLVRDKKEDRDARLIAMSALQTLDPKGLAKIVTKLTGDDGETDEIRGAGLTAMATLAPAAQPPALRTAATKLARKGKTPAARSAAKLYLDASSDDGDGASGE
jgi:hypothetical protein